MEPLMDDLASADAVTWTDEGCMAGMALDGGVSAVKLTHVS